MEFVYPLLSAFVLSCLLTRIVIASRDTLQWIVRPPQEDRWHRVKVPSLGGIAMFLTFTASMFWFGQALPRIFPLLLGGTVIFVMGLVDDLRPMPAYAKLIVQIATACLMVLLGVHVAFTGNPAIYIPLTILWLVGITNAFNLLDNMDGLAGGIALVTVIVLGFLTLGSESPLSPILLCILAGSILGFLVFNVHPAKIFMGDCGSQWLGFTLATLTILDTWKSATNLFLLLATPAFVLAVPILDTTLVTINRKIHGRPISQGGTDHASHRLVALGVGEGKTVVVLWLLSLIFGLIAILAHLFRVETWALLISGGAIFAMTFGLFLTDVKVYEAPRPADRRHRARVLNIDLLYKRRIVEILIDTILIGASYTLAYLLRFDWRIDAFNLPLLAKTLPMVMGVKLFIMLLFGLYRGIWGYVTFESVGRMFKVLLLASLATVFVIVAVYRFQGFSRTLFVIDFVLLFALMAGVRALLRSFRESVLAFPEGGIRLLLVGAGDASRGLLMEIRRRRDWNLRPVAILDDTWKSQGKALVGVPILGGLDSLERVARELDIDQILITAEFGSVAERQAVQIKCRSTGLPVITMPSTEDVLFGRATTS